MNKRFFLFFLFSVLISSLFAQVGVNTESPNPLTELDVMNLISSGEPIPKGIMIPRMTEAQRDLIDVSLPANNANSLLIYNTTEDCYNYYSKTEGEWQSLCGKMGKANFVLNCGTAQVYGKYSDGDPLNTSNYIKIALNVTKIGAYTIVGTSNPDNGYYYEASGTFYSLGPVTLTIPGTGQPVKHTQGTDLLNPADDTPDQFTLTSNGGGADCNFKVDVVSSAAHPKFTMNCALTVVEGMYFEDQALTTTPNPVNDQSHQIKVTLTVTDPSAYGAIAELTTNSVDGISFKGQAVLTGSTVIVYLTGTGVPRGLNDKIMTITSNSETSTASCTATVRMLIPRKRLMAVGQLSGLDLTYGYNPARNTTRSPKNSFNALLTDPNNFGYNQWSILRFQGFNNKGTGRDDNFIAPNTAIAVNGWVDDNRDIIGLETTAWDNMTATKLESLLKGTDGVHKVDIFMIGYDTEFYPNGTGATAVSNAAKCAKLVDFVKTGGILMICSEENTSNANFLNLLFENPSPAITSATGAASGSKYTLGFNNSDASAAYMKPYYCKDDDPILKGPFDDIVGRNWGEDASTTKYITNLPLDEVVIYSGARPIGSTTEPADGVTIFRHKTYPFVFVGDGGFNSSEARTYTGLTVCPFRLGVKTINGQIYNNYPVFRPHFGTAESNAGSVYNTTFTANAFAWCIMKAEELRKLNP